MDNKDINHRFDYCLTQDQRQWGFWVAGVGRRMVPPGTQYQVPEAAAPVQWSRGRILRDWGLVYLTRGSGRFRTASRDEQGVHAGHLLPLTPGVWHNYFPSPQTGWDEYWVTFGGPHAAAVMKHFLPSPDSAPPEPGLHAALQDLFASLLRIAAENRPWCNQILAGITMQILAQTRSLCSRFAQTPDDLRAEQARTHLETHWRQPVDLEALADSLGLSYRHFRRVFASATGRPPHQYLLELRINHAKQLLEEDRLKIRAVAARVGFRDPFHFSRVFREKTGVSPSQWRQ